MQDLNADALVETVRWALQTWRDKKDAFRAMQQRAMRKEFSWQVAAKKYGELYDWALERRRWSERR